MGRDQIYEWCCLGYMSMAKFIGNLEREVSPGEGFLCFSVKGEKHSCFGFANFSQQSWASAIPLAKGPEPSYFHLHGHKALAGVLLKDPKLCLRPKAAFPKTVQAQSCY